MKVLLFLSVFVNAVFVGYSVWNKETSVVLTEASSKAKVAAEKFEPADTGDYQMLRERGLTETEAKIILLHNFRESYLRPIWEKDQPYWTNNQIPYVFASLEDLAKSHDAIRVDIESTFGSDASEDDIFYELYHPLAIQHGYLPSDKQWLLQDFQRREQLAQFGVGDKPSHDDLEKILGFDWYLEFELRNSRIAHQLRSSRVTFTQNEFRQAFWLTQDLLRQSQLNQFDKLTDTRLELENLLGEARALELRTDMDSSLFALEQSALRAGISSKKALEVVQLITEFESELLDAHEFRHTDPQFSQQLVAEIVQERNLRLSNLVGSDLSERLMSARRSDALRKSK